jgi:hypothetical protein
MTHSAYDQILWTFNTWLAAPRYQGRISVFEPRLSETPSTKHQAPEKFQISNTKAQKQMPGPTARKSVFELGASLELGVSNLELAA